MIETGCGYATDERQKYCDWTWWRAADKETRVGERREEEGGGGGKAGFSPGGSHVDPICTESGASGTRIACEERLAKGGLGSNGPYRMSG